MAFKITARTILQLGAELISSDAIAFYELIKNAFDARSPAVNVRVVNRLSKNDITTFLEVIHKLQEGNAEEQSISIDDLKSKIVTAVIQGGYNGDRFKTNVSNASTLNALLSLIERSNYIMFSDTGEGMSLEDLEDIYLTIGTRSRQQQRQQIQNDDYPILGEKGIGRLSVMRLGDGLKVVTSKKGEIRNNELTIDWAVFSHNSDALLDSILVQPNLGELKADPATRGTNIYIYKLHSEWSKSVLQTIAQEQLSKFIDPFERLHRSFMKLWFNNEAVDIPPLNKVLFDSAHAVVEGRLAFVAEEPTLTGFINYKLHEKQKSFSIDGINLASITKTSLATIKNLGPFSFKFYWFNNRIIKEIEGIGKIKQVRALIQAWAGGLMVYRDGFRVFPYGSLDDDWLKLDPKAFSAGGYKTNRRQLIGKLDITSKQNPALIDQTNREGLRDCPEKNALIKILQHILWSEFTVLLDQTEKERLTSKPLDLDEIEARLESNEQRLLDNLNVIVAKFPQIRQEEQALNTIREALTLNKRLLNDLRTEKVSIQQRMEVTLHLAGLGLMVDIIAHELNRSTAHTLSTLTNVDQETISDQTKTLLKLLSTQLRTLQARLKILDPLGPSGRQTKEDFDLYELTKETLLSHQAQFDRHQIMWQLEPDTLHWNIKAVKGMFVQIFENLLANSVYWLKQLKVQKPEHVSRISILLDKPTQCIFFTDNGPGIPVTKKEDVFLPFVTTKPPGEGKGLGLYISREIAAYHGASLQLVDQLDSTSANLHTFVLDLTAIK